MVANRETILLATFFCANMAQFVMIFGLAGGVGRSDAESQKIEQEITEKTEL